MVRRNDSNWLPKFTPTCLQRPRFDAAENDEEHELDFEVNLDLSKGRQIAAGHGI